MSFSNHMLQTLKQYQDPEKLQRQFYELSCLFYDAASVAANKGHLNEVVMFMNEHYKYGKLSGTINKR